MAQQQMDISLALLLVSIMLRTIASQQCKGDSYSIYRMMLKGHTYKTFKARPVDCILTCNAEDRCQSLNYVMFNGMCELNNRTKEARPKDFIEDVDRYYLKKSPRGIFHFFEASEVQWPLTNSQCAGLARHFTLIVPLFTQVYKWVPANLRLASQPGGSRNIPGQFNNATKPWISSGLMGD